VQARHRYTAPGSFTLRLTVSDDAGVANSRVVESREITVTPAPVAGLAVAGQLCPGVAQPWSAPGGDGVSTLGDLGGADQATAE
jgi:hypothetical protein